MKAVYAAIDEAYQRIANYYHFNCLSCEDLCCNTLFFHYTVIEYAYLKRGLLALNGALQREIASRAKAYVHEIERAADLTGFRLPCPLNQDRRCMLYPCRPMICRFHGMPYQLDIAQKHASHGRGCRKFLAENPGFGEDDVRLDRTPFYKTMAELEIKTKRELGDQHRYRYTIAHAIRSILV